MLYTLNLCNFICELHLSEAGRGWGTINVSRQVLRRQAVTLRFYRVDSAP